MAIIEKKAGRLKTPFSYLFYGILEENWPKICQKICGLYKIEPSDIVILKGEESKGKKAEISIEQVRDLVHFINLTPFGEKKFAFIFGADKISLPAANAMLKILEEPPKDATLILFSESKNILPTIISRCLGINFQEKHEEKGDLAESEKIIQSDFTDASKQIEKIVKEERIAEFLDEIETLLLRELEKSQKVEICRLIKFVIITRKNIKQNANPRLALEALVLKIKEQ